MASEEAEKPQLSAQVLKTSEVVFKELSKDHKGKISVSSTVHALQLLDQAPTENQVRDILKQVGSDDDPHKNWISFETFSEILKAIYLPPDEHFKRLFQAFADLDETNRGILSADYLAELLLSRGEVLSKKQVKDLMRESNTGADGFFAYMGFVNHLLGGYSKFQPPKTKKGRKKNGK